MKNRINTVPILLATIMTATTVFATIPFKAIAQEPNFHELKIIATDTSGKEISGIWMTIRSASGTYIGSGYSPLSFPGESGNTYRVIAASYDGITFTQWEDGSTDRDRSVTLGADTNSTQVAARYDTDGSMAGVTPLEYKGADGQPSLTVKAMQGNETLNTWSVIQPLADTTTSANAGATYRVYAGNFQNHVFDHWSDGNKDRIRTLTIGENTTITANYRAGESAIVIPEGAEERPNSPYQPTELSVSKGTTIVVSNIDDAPHSLTSGSGPEDSTAANAFDTGLLFKGNYAHIETGKLHVGDYPFYCFVHPWMKGKLTVTE
jgi:plastocyanin